MWLVLYRWVTFVSVSCWNRVGLGCHFGIEWVWGVILDVCWFGDTDVILDQSEFGDTDVILDESEFGDTDVILDESEFGDTGVILDESGFGDTGVILDESGFGDIGVLSEESWLDVIGVMLEDRMCLVTLVTCHVGIDWTGYKTSQFESTENLVLSYFKMQLCLDKIIAPPSKQKKLYLYPL